MESKDHIRNTKPDELLKTRHEQLEKDGDANDKELDFDHLITTDAVNSDASETANSPDASNLTDARELDGSLLAEDTDSSLGSDGIAKADWGKVDPQSTPGGSRSGMDPSGPGSAV